MSVRVRILGRMETQIPPNLRRVITEQAGVGSRQQLLRAGVSRTTIDSRVKRGRWQRLHPGVYGTFTGTVSRDALLWAGVLSPRPGTVRSQETAAEILGLTDRGNPLIQLTIPSRRRVHPRQGMTIHRSTVESPGGCP